MKKIIVSLCAVILTLGTFSSARADLLTTGFNAGLNSATYKSSQYGTFDSNLGFHIGAYARIAVPVISITPELNYNNNSFNIDHEDFDGDLKITNHYLSMPIVAGLKLLPFITIEAGPRFTLLDRAVVKVDGEKEKVNGALHDSVGYVLGLRFNLGKMLVISGRYNGHFDGVSSEEFGDMKSSSYTVSVGFKL